MEDNTERQNTETVNESAPLSILFSLQEKDLFSQPHQIPLKEGGLESRWREKYPESGEEQIRQNLLGRGFYPGS